MTEIIHKILSAQGGYLNLLLVLLLLIAAVGWFILVFIKKDLKSAFYLQILLLPATFKSQNLVGFTVYDKTPSYTDILGLTTIGIVVLLYNH